MRQSHGHGGHAPPPRAPRHHGQDHRRSSQLTRPRLLPVVFGPTATTWFGLLQRHVRLPGRPNAEIVARVACDQGMFAPVMIGVFLSSMALLEGSSPADKLASSYVPALSANYLIWPAVQLLNFKFVPLHHRVLTVNLVSIGWNSYLSFLNSKGGSDKAPRQDAEAVKVD